ncbi:MAG: hypothetical protein KF768_09725 [Phycisphaeraceae bacterium]|nr:hypothetical protein [Phycisphaeraceae bacterium]
MRPAVRIGDGRSVDPGAESLRKRRPIAIAFFAYALGLFVLTHWPRLTVEVEGIDRPDLFIHVAAYGLWTALLIASGLLGSWRSTATVLRCGLVAAIWSALDEWSQGLPFVQRHATWDDAFANWAGVGLATAGGLIVARLASRPR